MVAVETWDACTAVRVHQSDERTLDFTHRVRVKKQKVRKDDENEVRLKISFSLTKTKLRGIKPKWETFQGDFAV